MPDNHPDWHVVRLEEDAQQIKVDQIRGLIESLSLSSYRGGYKVGIVEGAEALNANGANAFLKTLEEPTDRTLLVMIARPSHRLPATIASRCLRLHLRPPAEPVALELARGAGDPARGIGRRRSLWRAAHRCWPWNWRPAGLARARGGDAGDSSAIERWASIDVTLLADALGQVRSAAAADLA